MIEDKTTYERVNISAKIETQGGRTKQSHTGDGDGGLRNAGMRTNSISACNGNNQRTKPGSGESA